LYNAGGIGPATSEEHLGGQDLGLQVEGTVEFPSQKETRLCLFFFIAYPNSEATE
jgi:hypothetical protein